MRFTLGAAGAHRPLTPWSVSAPEIGHNGAVRRSLAGLLFGAAFFCACLALSGLLLQRAMYSPSDDRDTAEAVLADTTIRNELVRVITDAAATTLGRAPNELSATVTQVLSTKSGAALITDVLRDAHARIVGQLDDRAAVITTTQLVEVVRDERAATVPPVTLDIDEVSSFGLVSGLLDWVVPLCGIGTVVFLVLCLLSRPERAALVRTAGLGLVLLGALTIVFGYVVPTFLPTAISDSPWARIPSLVAADAAALTVFVALVLAGAGLVLFGMSARMGRSRRWSTPVSTYRYREERRWS